MTDAVVVVIGGGCSGTSIVWPLARRRAGAVVLLEKECLAAGATGRSSAVARRGSTGVYDCSPDLQPILGPVPGIDGLWVAPGFSGHGFKLRPAVGELMAERILEGRSTLVDLDLLGLARFAEDRPIRGARPYSVARLG